MAICVYVVCWRVAASIFWMQQNIDIQIYVHCIYSPHPGCNRGKRRFRLGFPILKMQKKHSLKLTASSPLKIGRAPKGNNRIPTIHFQMLWLLVSGRVIIIILLVVMSQHPGWGVNPRYTAYKSYLGMWSTLMRRWAFFQVGVSNLARKLVYVPLLTIPYQFLYLFHVYSKFDRISAEHFHIKFP